MTCPECDSELEPIEGQFGTGVFAPDGVEESYWERGYYCRNCKHTFDDDELDTYTAGGLEGSSNVAPHRLGGKDAVLTDEERYEQMGREQESREEFEALVVGEARDGDPCAKCGKPWSLDPWDIHSPLGGKGAHPFHTKTMTTSAERRKNMTAEEIAKDMGKQLNGKVICPRCRVDSWPDEEQQTLSTYGDFEDTLFCPHCELDLHLKITNL